jgi:acyl phosphate:glycerol-3-phosphate acyltransferase
MESDMFTVWASLMSALIGYALGAFPTGFFAGRFWNVDVRKHGSGRTGGTNVLRSAGWGAFAITVIGDILKGAVAVLISRWLFPPVDIGHALAVLGALLGHNWSIWIAMLARPDPGIEYAPPPMGWLQRVAQQGRGGAGVATTAAAMLTLFPPVVLVLLVPVLLILFIFRYASLASLSAAVLSPFVMLYFSLAGNAPWSFLILNIIVSVIIIWVHRPNIERLRAGTEKKFGQRLGQRAPRE